MHPIKNDGGGGEAQRPLQAATDRFANFKHNFS